MTQNHTRTGAEPPAYVAPLGMLAILGVFAFVLARTGEATTGTRGRR